MIKQYLTSALYKSKLFILKRPRLFLALLSFFSLLLLLNHFLVSPLQFLYNESKEIRWKLSPVKDAYDSQNPSALLFELQHFRRELLKINRNVSKVAVFSPLPLVGSYLKDAKNLSDGLLGLFDDLMVLAGQSQEVFFKQAPGQPLGGKLEKVDRLLPVIRRNLPQLKPKIRRLAEQVLSINENKYPKSINGRPVRAHLKTAKELSRLMINSLEDLDKVLNLTPQLLGSDSPKTYLVLIQNENALKPAGGSLSGYAFLEVKNAQPQVIKSGDISFLDRVTIGPQESRIKDANSSADFKASAQKIDRIWQSTPRPLGLEGIVAVDEALLQRIIGVVGEIKITDKITANRETLPKIMDGFFRSVGRKSVSAQKSKDLTAVLLNEIFKKILSLDRANYLQLAKTFWELSREKHFLVYSKNESAQALLEKYNLAGRVRSFDGDYLHLNLALSGRNQNSAKIKQRVARDLTRSENRLTAKLKIDLLADTEAKINLKIFVPQSSQLIESEPTMVTTEELGKTVFSTTLQLWENQPQNVEVKYAVPGSVVKNGTYRLLIQKQPGTPNFDYTVDILGKSRTFALSEDKELTLNL